MIKKIPRDLVMCLLVLALAGCATTATPGSLATNIPPTQAARPTETSPTATTIPPVLLATAVPPTPTATPSSTGVIQHFTAGQDFTVTSIHMTDASIGWAIGGLTDIGDHILTTSDGGSTWKDVTPPQPLTAGNDQQVADGFFQDAQTAWVTYAINGGNPVPTQAVIWRTDDGGATWTASQPLDTTNLTEIYVPSDLQFVGVQNGPFVGWLLVHVGVGMMHDYVVIYRSTDAGMTWSRILDPFNDGGIQSCSKTAMLFTDATHGWLTGDCHGVKAGALLFKSTDAGASWQEVSLPEPTSYPGIFSNDAPVACGTYDPFFFGNDLGHLGVNCSDYQGTQITSTYYIYTTQDGGTTWTSALYPGTSLYFYSAETGWAISSKIQLTTDGGKTWKPISDVTWTPQMDFISEKIGWAVARSDNAVALVKSDNGGASWSELIPSVGK